MVVIPQYTDEVQVVLSAIGPLPGELIRDRYLFLSKDNTKAFIGRTSKRDASLEAADNNGWIDSAVMSRDHAVLELDPVEKVITVVDIGSLHGTYLNDLRLSKYQAKEIHAGDTLRFGVPIQKGTDVFTPCKMKVALNFGSLAPVNHPVVFRVPESTDGEEEESEESEAEDPIIEQTVEILRTAGLKPSVGTLRRSARSSSGAVEADGGDADVAGSIDEGEAEVAMQSPAILDSLDEEILFDNGEELMEAQHKNHIDLSQLNDSEEEDYLFAAMSSPSSSSHSFVSSDDDLANTTKLTEPETPTKTGVLEDEMQHEHSLEQRDTALHTSPGDDITEKATGGINVAEDIESFGDLHDTEGLSTVHDDSDELVPIDSSQASHPNVSQLYSTCETNFTPLPSGVKTANAEEVAAILGAKSGKTEYFAAREHNRRALSDKLASQYHEGARTEAEGGHQGATTADLVEDLACTTPINLISAAFNHSATSPSASAAKLLQTPLKETEAPYGETLLLVEDDVFDGTSAYMLEASPTSMTHDEAGQATPRLIDETMVHEMQPTSNNVRKCTKRKADEISVLSAQEAPENHADSPSLNGGSAGSCIQVQHTTEGDHHALTRPAKRLRQVAEVFGIAALGGVAVMTALIATAPTL